MQSQLDLVVSRYNDTLSKMPANQHLELEIRINNASVELFKKILGHYTQKREVKHTVDIYSDTTGKDKIQQINTIEYKDKKAISVGYSKKQRLFEPTFVKEPFSYRIGMALEYPCDKFVPPTNATIRFKDRVSFQINDKWRMDLTALRQQKLNTSNNKEIRDNMFPTGQTGENFIATISEFATSYECEMEFTGKVIMLEDFNIIAEFNSLINPGTSNEHHALIMKLAGLIHPTSSQSKFLNTNYRLKHLTNQVLAINRNTYYSEIYPPTNYLLTDKADGFRCIIYVDGDIWIILSDKLVHIKRPEQMEPLPLTVVDAEMVGDDVYCFDVLLVNNKNIVNEPMSNRITHLHEAVSIMRRIPSNIKFTAKEYVVLGSDLEKDISELWHKKREYAIDGLILSEPNDSYTLTRNYKWKPENTIDFLAMECPIKLRGVIPYTMRENKTLYLLFNGIAKHVMDKLGLAFVRHYKTIFPATEAQYFPIQFSPSAQPYAYLFYSDNPNLDGKIVELVKKNAASEWEMVKIREDRKMEPTYYGNDFMTAEITFMNYIDVFTLEDLWKAPTHYFRGVADDMYAAKNKYMRFVISTLLKNNFSNSERVIDMAAGRGADLHRLAEIKVGEALFIDIDPTGIVELIRRKFAFSKQRSRRIGSYDNNFEKTTTGMTVHVMRADLKTNYLTLLTEIKQFGMTGGIVDNIMCNFAVHYLCDSKDNLYNFFQLCSSLLKIGGLVLITTMSGEKIFNLLSDVEQNKSWEVREGEVLKYAIKKNYDSKTLAKFGQTISIKLPFSDQMYDEPLCNISALIQTARKCGLEVELNSHMGDHMTEFNNVNKGLYDRLTADDKTYILLHQYVTLRKIKNVNY